MEPVPDFKDKDSQVPLTAAGKPVSVLNPSSLIPQLPRDSRGSLEVFNPSSFSSSSAHRPQQLPSRYAQPPTWSPQLPQLDDSNSTRGTSESVEDQSGFEKWTIGNRDVEGLWDNKKGEMAERAAEWGLVLKRDEETGEAAGVEVRKSGDIDQQLPAAGHVIRSTGTSRKDSGGGGGGGSVRSSTEDSEGGDHHQIGAAGGGLLPRVSRDLKEALSAFQQTFVVSDATKADYPILYASAGFFKMTGYTAKEVIGRNCRFLQGAGTDPGDVSRIRESLQTGTSFCGRLLNYKKDGSPFWNLLTITPIKDDTGKILKFIGMQVEVSKHTEGVKEKVTRPNGMPESLIRYDARQKDMAVSSMSEIVTAVRNPAALGQVTDQSTITKVLKPFRRRSEGSNHEVAVLKKDAIGRRYSDNSTSTLPTSSRRSSETTTSSSTPGFLTRQSMESITEEPPLFPSSESKKPAKSTAGIRSLIGKMRKNSGVKQDQKLIIDQLAPVSGLGNNGEESDHEDDDDDDSNMNVPHEKKREMRRGLDLATTLERIEKNFVITDPRLPDNPIIFASDSFLELTEYSREEILGKNCRFLQGPETDRATVRQIRQAIDNQREVTVQLINYTKSGKKFWNLFHLQPMRDQKGEVQYFIGVQLDGSEHVEPLHNGLPEFAAAEGEKLVKETAGNVDEAARELPDANLKPEDLWIKHSKPVHAKPHRKEDPSWRAIEKVLESGEQIGLKHLKPIRPLGSGDTGSVHLVELRGTGLCFAMKAMDKNVMLNRNKVHRACAEREILDMLDHPFLPALYASFQTKTHVCLVTDYCPGGELFMLLDRQPTKVLNEAAVRFYAAEVVIALEYLHCQGIIYRDLKPENILLQQNGHIALTDFDLSCLTSCKPQLINTSNNEKRKHQKIRTPPIFVAEPVRESNSFVGTEEYIAPEIITGAGHTSAVDWWALGILLYEMFYGYTPFRGKTRQKTFTNILQKDLKFPASIQVSLPARQLMYSLLIRDPKNRLGSHEGANEIKQHLFFRGINWPLVRCMEPPKFEASQVEEKGAELGDKAIEVTSDWKDDNGLQDLQANVF